MEELAALFQDMEALVVQQEPMVDVIDQKGEETKQHVEKGNEELSQGVVKARAARRKKWWCLLICSKPSFSFLLDHVPRNLDLIDVQSSLQLSSLSSLASSSELSGNEHRTSMIIEQPRDLLIHLQSLFSSS